MLGAQPKQMLALQELVQSVLPLQVVFVHAVVRKVHRHNGHRAPLLVALYMVVLILMHAPSIGKLSQYFGLIMIAQSKIL